MQRDALDKTCDALMELQVRRKFFIGLSNKQTNAAKALVRRALSWQWDDDEQNRDAVNKRAESIVDRALSEKDQKDSDLPIIAAIGGDLAKVRECLLPGQKARKEIEKEMVKLVKTLPAHEWQKTIFGFGDLALAVVIGEAGNLSNYDHPDKLKKRLGLAPHQGKAFSTWRREGGLSADEWSEAGYSPRRLGQVFSVLEPMFRQQAEWAEKEQKDGTIRPMRPAGHYGLIYYSRRERTATTHSDWTPKHSHNDGLRVMFQAVITDLWSEWRRAMPMLPERARGEVPSAEIAADAITTLEVPDEVMEWAEEVFAEEARQGATQAVPQGHGGYAPAELSA